MSSRPLPSISALACFLLLLFVSVFPASARAAWVNAAGTSFTVGGNLRAITPTVAPTFADPTCGNSGGTSLALVPGSKLVPELPYPVVLIVSCLDSNTTVQTRLNFINPANGAVVKQLSTTTAPTQANQGGWAHLVYRPDKGDLLGCGVNGDLYTITLAGIATLLPRPAVPNTCTGLAWDAEADMIYLGLNVGGSNTSVGRVVRFKDGTTSLLGDFAGLPCDGNGLVISGGVVLMSCEGSLNLFRLDKNTGVVLGVQGTLSATGLPVLSPEPGLGDLACDPVTFQKDSTGKDLFTDAIWSRRRGSGGNINGVAALEFPAFTCGLPSNSVVLQGSVPLSPLAAGFSAPGPSGPGQLPLAACFDSAGKVIDLDGDGLPDCWEGTNNGIDFSGRGGIDLPLCVAVDTNGDGITDTTECADPTFKDLFVEIDWMQNHKPDPLALSQTQSVATAGVKSVREAFAAAPVPNPLSTASLSNGIRIHFQVDEQVTFTPLAGGAPTSHVTQVAFTPCTGPATAATDTSQAVDFDVVKAGNFGTADDRARGANTLNAKRLAFRYVLFAHNVVGNPGGGSNGSGCAEVGGDDAVITLGSFVTTTVDGVSHGRGTTDQQAGTFMHELGHTLGLRHGGSDGFNCKPNYRSVMSYTRQFAWSPIANRRLDYSRSADPVLQLPTSTNPNGVLNEASLNELNALGIDPTLGPIPVYFPSVDQIAYGPNAWSVVAANAASITPPGINWNRNFAQGGKTPVIDSGNLSTPININSGATAGCDGLGDVLVGQNDWSNLLYRTSAAIDFAGGARSQGPAEITSDHEKAFYLARDVDGNGAGDGTDCGGTINPDGTTSFSCTHRIDIKPSFPFPKTIKPGSESTITIAIFSEVNGNQVWDAPAQVKLDASLKFSVETFETPVKVNNSGSGTCSISDVEDPLTGRKDGRKDLKCQFPTSVNGVSLPAGTHFGILSGIFSDPLTGTERAFSARQEVTILE